MECQIIKYKKIIQYGWLSAEVQDNKLYGTTPGVTYIQKYNARTEEINAYKVVVE